MSVFSNKKAINALAAAVICMGTAMPMAGFADTVSDITIAVKDASKKNTTHELSMVEAGLVPGKSESTYSTAIGRLSFGDPSIGKNSTMSVAIGDVARVGSNAQHSISLGYNAKVSNNAEKSVVVGTNSNVSKKYGIAVGEKVTVNSQNAIAIGQNAVIQGNATNSVAIGGLYAYSEDDGVGGGGNYMVESGAKNSTVIGAATLSQSEGGTAIGQGARVTQNAANSVALGTNSKVYQRDITATDTHGVVSVGESGKAGFERRIVNVADGIEDSDAATVGQIKTITGLDATKGTVVQYDGADKKAVTLGGTAGTAIHNVSDITMVVPDALQKNTTHELSMVEAGLVPGKSESSYSTAIGKLGFGDSSIGTKSNGSVTIGDVATVGSNAQHSISLGYNAAVADNAEKSIVVGTNGSVTKKLSIAVGEKTSVNSQNSIAIGQNATIQTGATNSVAIGGQYEYSEEDGVGGGGKYMVEKGAKNSTVIGAATLSQSEGGTAIGQGARVTQKAANSVALGTKSYVYGDDILDSDTHGVVSIGETDEFTRRLINVSAGVNGTDAVNVNQLNQALKGYAGTGDLTKGSVVQYEKDGSLNAGQDTTGKVKLQNDGSAAITSSNGKGTVKTTNAASSMIYDKNGITVDRNGTTIEGNTNINGDLNVNGNFSVNGKTLVTQDKFDDMSKSLGDMKFDNGAATATAAINQNTAAAKTNAQDIQKTKDYIGTNSDGSFKTMDNGAKTVVEGINSNTTAIQTNAAAIQENRQTILGLGRNVVRLSDEIDSVGAISAALAGLHPLDYSSNAKFQISAAVGTYDGTQAAAVGGFYHANKDVLFSLGASRSFNGEHKTAANFGVTFRVGQSGSTTIQESTAATQQEVNELKQQIRILQQEIENMKKA